MSPSIVELDFFLPEKKDSTASSIAAHNSSLNKIFHRRHNFRDISKINPELLKRFIASGSAEACSNADIFAPNTIPSTPKDAHFSFPALPVASKEITNGVINEQNHARSAPLTIFYNGTVAMFDVTQKQAENILKLAQEEGSKAVLDSKLAVSPTSTQKLLARFNRDLPMARKMSLLRFLEERKKRLISVSPYACPMLAENASSSYSYSY